MALLLNKSKSNQIQFHETKYPIKITFTPIINNSLFPPEKIEEK